MEDLAKSLSSNEIIRKAIKDRPAKSCPVELRVEAQEKIKNRCCDKNSLDILTEYCSYATPTDAQFVVSHLISVFLEEPSFQIQYSIYLAVCQCVKSFATCEACKNFRGQLDDLQKSFQNSTDGNRSELILKLASTIVESLNPTEAIDPSFTGPFVDFIHRGPPELALFIVPFISHTRPLDDSIATNVLSIVDSMRFSAKSFAIPLLLIVALQKANIAIPSSTLSFWIEGNIGAQTLDEQLLLMEAMKASEECPIFSFDQILFFLKSLDSNIRSDMLEVIMTHYRAFSEAEISQITQILLSQLDELPGDIVERNVRAIIILNPHSLPQSSSLFRAIIEVCNHSSALALMLFSIVEMITNAEDDSTKLEYVSLLQDLSESLESLEDSADPTVSRIASLLCGLCRT